MAGTVVIDVTDSCTWMVYLKHDGEIVDRWEVDDIFLGPELKKVLDGVPHELWDGSYGREE